MPVMSHLTCVSHIGDAAWPDPRVLLLLASQQQPSGRTSRSPGQSRGRRASQRGGGAPQATPAELPSLPGSPDPRESLPARGPRCPLVCRFKGPTGLAVRGLRLGMPRLGRTPGPCFSRRRRFSSADAYRPCRALPGAVRSPGDAAVGRTDSPGGASRSQSELGALAARYSGDTFT